jgi:hypothetical protein
VIRFRRVFGVGVVVSAMAAMSVAPAAAQSSAPKATEIGVTAKEIHIAVVADVDNPFAPGVFQGAVDGVKGGAAYLNSKAGGGGVAGRKLVVDFIDSKLNPNAARNAVISACQNDLALVGTSALFLTTVEDEVNCKDQAGQAVGLPDIGGVVTGVPQSCAPTSFPVSGTQLVCSTKDQNPQTYNGNQGEAKYFLKQNKNLHGSFMASNDTKDAQRGGEVLEKTAQTAGIKADQQITLSGRDQQSAYTPVVSQMKAAGSNYSLLTLAANSAVQLRSEAQLQGLDSSKIIWDCVSCYGNKAITDAKAVMEGEYAALQYLPFEEAKFNPTLAAFLKYVGLAKADQFSVYGFSAVLAFADAVKAAVAKGGVNDLTRSSLLTGIKTLTSFDAGGMVGAHDFKTAKLTSCFVLTQFKSGKWVRVYPTKKGTFDCKPSNSIQFQANFLGS